MKPLLTIAIPTYNRADYLERLLEVLHGEVPPLAPGIAVLISDNASSDRTPDVVARMAGRWPALVHRRNAVNVGPDRNFCLMLDPIETRYVWIVGDDDVPKIGALSRILHLLATESPALVYLQNEWQKVVDPTTRAPDELRYRVVDRDEFAVTVHLWTTFVSGMIIDRSVVAGLDTRRFLDTFLVQLGWVLPALSRGDRFVVVEDACVVATQDNTGGYGILNVFGVNFPTIVRDCLGQHAGLPRRLIDASLRTALPSLVWSTRMKGERDPNRGSTWRRMARALGLHWRFWLILLPLGLAPRPLAGWLHRLLLLRDRWQARTNRRRRGGQASAQTLSIGAFPPDFSQGPKVDF